MLFPSKKAQSLSIHTIVIAALALLVLAVVALLLFNGLKKASTQVNACESAGGVCIPGDGAGVCDSKTRESTSPYHGKLSKPLDLTCDDRGEQKQQCCLFI